MKATAHRKSYAITHCAVGSLYCHRKRTANRTRLFLKRNMEILEDKLQQNFRVSIDEIQNVTTEKVNSKHKSFHLNTYAFDSKPEHKLFWSLLTEGKVKEVYFTGMLTHGQSDFYIQYIDPESHTVRRYYPDFLVQKDDDAWVIVEVKGDNKIDDDVVLAKAEAAEQRASASQMSYKIIEGSKANKEQYQTLLE